MQIEGANRYFLWVTDVGDVYFPGDWQLLRYLEFETYFVCHRWCFAAFSEYRKCAISTVTATLRNLRKRGPLENTRPINLLYRCDKYRVSSYFGNWIYVSYFSFRHHYAIKTLIYGGVGMLTWVFYALVALCNRLFLLGPSMVSGWACYPDPGTSPIGTYAK